jgi:glycosyltransferase involved in cell wall biosynthesis
VTHAPDPADMAGGPTPHVSVVIPCYGQAAYLPEAVDSVIGQTFVSWEILIVDDGSPDDTAAVATSLAAEHGRIRLIRQANAGPASARNTGFREARGRYILPLDADDRILPSMLADTVAALDAHADRGFAYTDYRFFGDVERTVRTPDFDVDMLCRSNYITVCSLMRRTTWEAVGGYDPSMARGYEDWDFWLSCAERGISGVRVPEVLFEYRVRPGSRNAMAQAHERELQRQIGRNHRALVTARRRVLGRLKWFAFAHAASRGHA